MKLSAQITATLKFGLLMLIFSFLVFLAYSSGKKITDNHKKRKTSYYFIVLPSECQHPTFSLHLMKNQPLSLINRIYNFECEYDK